VILGTYLSYLLYLQPPFILLPPQPAISSSCATSSRALHPRQGNRIHLYHDAAAALFKLRVFGGDQLPQLADNTQHRRWGELKRLRLLPQQIDYILHLMKCNGKQLLQALLSKAFSGQLVPQAPSDEPASALLERLRTPLASTPAPTKGKRGRKPNARAKAPLFD
jgi:hypothetical protein